MRSRQPKTKLNKRVQATNSNSNIMPGGGDWSGQRGHRCDYCGRSSDNVGPRRGFDYVNDVCGGCCELSSDDDGHTEEGHCRQCKRFMYMHGGPNCAPVSCFDTYCGNCVKLCELCSEHVHPHREMDKYSVPLDEAIKNIIDEDDFSIERLGVLAKDGETMYLCKECHKTKWKRHPNHGKAFPGYTVEEINESSYDGEDKRRALQHYEYTKKGHCRKCKRVMYSHGGQNCAPVSSFDNYCRDCCKLCQLCSEDVHPFWEMNTYSVPLDEAIKNIIDEVEPSIDVLGDDAKDGETIYLCEECFKTKWKLHPNRGKAFPGYIAEELEEYS